MNAALETVNGDINNTGYSPAQLVLGKQPRIAGDSEPSDIRSRMASSSMTETENVYNRSIMLMRQAAKLAMVRFHYSQSLARASTARSRVQPDWDAFAVGDVVYFFREQKPTSKRMKQVQRKRLELRKWHGPAVLLSLKGGSMPVAGYVAYRGNVTKVAMEHLRHASAQKIGTRSLKR